MIELAVTSVNGAPTSGPFDQRGATVADARAFAKKADAVFIHFRTGARDYADDCVQLTPAAFLKLIAAKPESLAFASRLQRYRFGERWLHIG